MDGPKRLRLATSNLEDPLNLSLSAVKAENKSADLSLVDMRSRFQQWVQKTYQDSSKTKTITSKKYERIVKTLAGEIKNCAENSKFRFWMKCKGFKLDVTNEGTVRFLLVQDKKGEGVKYKKVAVVENFFDIIYDVHVNEGARGIKHAGQKRTHRVITETYAFLPREAVTQFLLCCTDCQKRLTEDRKHSPTSSCDSNQPQPVDLLDFHSQSHFDQTPTMPLSPSTSTIACPCASPPSSHLRDNNNDSNLQPFDYSSRLSPVSLAADTIRKQRKRKVTRKIIRLGDECQNDEVLDYSSNKSSFDSCAGNYRSPSAEPSMEATEQTCQMDTQDSDIYKFSENAQLHVNESENMTRTESDCEPLQHKYNSNTCQRQCPFIEKISEVLYNPVKYAMKVQRQSDSPMNEDFLEQSAVDLLLKARHLETMKEVLTDHDREQILLKIYSCRIISFMLSYAADLMLRLMVDDQISN